MRRVSINGLSVSAAASTSMHGADICTALGAFAHTAASHLARRHRDIDIGVTTR